MVRRGWPCLLVVALGVLHGGGLRGDDNVLPPPRPAPAPAPDGSPATSLVLPAPAGQAPPAGPTWPLVLPLLSKPPLWIPPNDPWSNVGFIDAAIPWDVVRTRFDAFSNINRPTRGQYLFAPQGPGQKGLPIVESRIDYQETSLYVEKTILPNASAFVQVPYRFLDPQNNENHAGFGNMQAGFKLAGVQTHDATITLQFRTYIPTGLARRGLGNGEAALEPGLLFNWQAAPLWLVEAQVLGYFPVNDTHAFGSEVVQWGAGISYGDRAVDGFWAVPVLEVMAWSLPRGKEQILITPRRVVTVTTSGDTIANGFVGIRAGYGCQAEVYLGYGRALTGEVWYKNTLRLELRYYY